MELERCINFVLTKAQQAVHQVFKAELAPWGVTPGQYAVLKCLWEQNGQTAKALAERLSVDGSTMTGTLDRMEQKGLIEKHPDPRDRRALRVTLSPRGRELEKPLNEAIERANRKVLEGLDPVHAALLSRMLQGLGEERHGQRAEASHG
ncbi:MAG: MarR family transcriptional regulator [Syntrophomonadaceae bacterium]|jgi:DNA-binding MarR family transcriptional regulator|nr:MarR family transcriptional regulator [Syntrophomonadaceae bacterium]